MNFSIEIYFLNIYIYIYIILDKFINDIYFLYKVCIYSMSYI